jgi:hypothetical protein
VSSKGASHLDRDGLFRLVSFLSRQVGYRLEGGHWCVLLS